MEESSEQNPICPHIPPLLSSFINTFIDFSISGLFLPPPPTPSPPTLHHHHRIVALGDLHGDLHKTHQALRLSGLIDSSLRWSGGSSLLIQVGDVLDRGGDEIKILYFLESLKRQAAKTGGAVITMNGNHEIMNVDGDFRYVTQKGLREFEQWAFWYDNVGNGMRKMCPELKGQLVSPFEGVPLRLKCVDEKINDGVRARIAALRPNGVIAKRFLAKNETVVVVGGSVFVHGGLLAKHVEYGLERINEEVKGWISGERGRVESGLVRGRNSVVWLRRFSYEIEKNCDCVMLDHVLKTIPGAKRMVMGHTIQENGINGVCENKAIRIDVGLSKGCGNGLPEVLEINGEREVRVLTSNPLFSKGYEYGLGGVGVVEDGVGSLMGERGPRQVEVKA